MTPLANASYGTIRALAILALLYDPNPPLLTCMEEIDHGLHPHVFDRLVELMRQASRHTVPGPDRVGEERETRGAARTRAAPEEAGRRGLGGPHRAGRHGPRGLRRGRTGAPRPRGPVPRNVCRSAVRGPPRTPGMGDGDMADAVAVGDARVPPLLARAGGVPRSQPWLDPQGQGGADGGRGAAWPQEGREGEVQDLRRARFARDRGQGPRARPSRRTGREERLVRPVRGGSS
ncbi:MAG: ATP-binding protein [Deltaproteobacteria bacterium]|nr:ATP-binding protein [Deltaproteobacteria bacterium]